MRGAGVFTTPSRGSMRSPFCGGMFAGPRAGSCSSVLGRAMVGGFVFICPVFGCLVFSGPMFFGPGIRCMRRPSMILIEPIAAILARFTHVRHLAIGVIDMMIVFGDALGCERPRTMPPRPLNATWTPPVTTTAGFAKTAKPGPWTPTKTAVLYRNTPPAHSPPTKPVP